MTDEEDDAVIDAAKLKGRVSYLEERVEHFQRALRLSTEALARTEASYRQVDQDLRHANVLANRYEDLLCVIVKLADMCPDIPQDIALVVQEAMAVARCEEAAGAVQ